MPQCHHCLAGHPEKCLGKNDPQSECKFDDKQIAKFNADEDAGKDTPRRSKRVIFKQRRIYRSRF